MATESKSAMSDNFTRLSTFQLYPLPVPGGPNHATMLRYNSPLKMSRAGFYRHPDASGDEVKCYRCSVAYRGWAGESPIAVHRILSPDCPHVVSQTPACLTAPVTRVGSNRVRRRLQMGSPTPNKASDGLTENAANQESVLEVYDSYHIPSTPNQSDTEEEDDDLGFMLFESHRLLTYPSPTHPLAEEWAASGFVHQGEGGVVRCIFCGLELQYEVEQPAKLHQQQSQNCPLVKYLDVGNIPRDLENKIRSKHLEQIGDNQELYVSDNPLFKHPQFEDIHSRLDTYKYWPKTLPMTADALTRAGFFYSGYADKVVCFACGCSLRNWEPEADTWTQHARHAPHCVFVKQEKGDAFIIEAQDAPELTHCDTPAGDSNSLHTSSPLRPSLDMSAITAALACGSYPNEALLLGTLRASDVNFKQLQRQRETIHTKNQSIIRQAEQLQKKDHELDRAGEVIHQQETVIEENQTDLEREQQRREREVRDLQVMLARKDTLVQSQAQVIQSHSHHLHTTYLQMQDQADQLGNQTEELERKQREMDRQAEELRRQTEENRRQAEEMQKLRQLLQANNITINNDNDNANHNNANPPLVPLDPSSPYTRCKVCLEEDARCVFRPCRHMCCGTQCAPRFVGGNCPICRNHVQDWEIIYVA